MEKYYEENEDFAREHDQWKRRLLDATDDFDYYLLDYYSVRALSAGGQPKTIKRLAQQHTVSIPMIKRWEDFNKIAIGMPPQRGRGVSSSLLELAMKLLMSIYTNIDVDHVAAELALTLSNRKDIPRLTENLLELIDELNKMMPKEQ